VVFMGVFSLTSNSKTESHLLVHKAMAKNFALFLLLIVFLLGYDYCDGVESKNNIHFLFFLIIKNFIRLSLFFDGRGIFKKLEDINQIINLTISFSVSALKSTQTTSQLTSSEPTSSKTVKPTTGMPTKSLRN